jgi:integrase
VFATAVEDEILDRNPCRLKGVTARAAVERVPASPVQVAAAAQASPPRFRVAVLLAAFSGLRGGELFALARRHVDLVGGSIQVERTLSELPGGVVTFGPTKTAASTRTVHLGPTLTRQLAEHLDRFAAADPDALVFTTATGRAVTRSYRSQWWGRARRAAGLPEGFRWHDLRHTGATLALTEGGATVRDLQARHGWSNSRMALHYAHATDERARMVAQRLDRVLERVMLEPDSGDAKSMPASPA